MDYEFIGLLIFALVLIVLFAGTPDLMDGIIHYLMDCDCGKVGV